jgi:hypothetical protein
MDAALQKASPTPRDPVQAHDEWACVGISKDVEWADPLWSGPDGVGHVFMFEFPRAGLSRKDRKAIEESIREMAESVTSLSKIQRYAMVRGVREMKGWSDPLTDCQNDASFGVGRPCPWACLPRRLRGKRLAASGAPRSVRGRQSGATRETLCVVRTGIPESAAVCNECEQ